MRLVAALTLAMFPFAAVAYTALHYRAMGADGGVLWCVALLAGVVAICVIGAHLERRMPA